MRTPLQDRPDVDTETVWFMSAFGTLSASRSVGMSLGSIPLSEIVIYWREVGRIGPIKEFVRVMRAMDSEWLRVQSERNRKDHR